MNVGPRFWHWVTTDTAGVPHGGRYGDVPRFEAILRRHNLYLGWSRVKKCFGIASKNRRNGWCCQMVLTTGQGVIPLNNRLVSALLTAWAEHGRTNTGTVIEAMIQKERDRKTELAKEQFDFYADRKGDVVKDIRRRTGQRLMIPVHGLRRAV
jgi:hypothetical protein